MDVALSEDEVVPQIWNAYKKTKEYQIRKMHGAMPPHHPLVEMQEREGLKDIYKRQIKTLLEYPSASLTLEQRTVGEWLADWKKMHRLLFRHILKDCGELRGISVRFGNPADKELYRTPEPPDVPRELNEFAHEMPNYLSEKSSDPRTKYKALARLHYRFIRIHPFADGNGRIARALTDQVAIYFGFPPAVAGYPRHNIRKRDGYHRAIRACIFDPDCNSLSFWISNYIEQQLRQLA